MLMLGDCIEKLKTLPDCSVDAVVTDPPYGLAFMGKKWDYDVPAVEVWAECLRVLKPGGHLLAFAGTRTQHRMAVRIEDAGFEIRDMIAWVYGSGFPKSLNLKDDWQGWGTALKPAMEPITVARKPLAGTVAENVQEWGTGAINVDGCRIGTTKSIPASPPKARKSGSMAGAMPAGRSTDNGHNPNVGRWPANLIHDGSEEVVGLFPDVKAGVAVRGNQSVSHFGNAGSPQTDIGYADSGSAARFFYCAKASKADRDEGCDGLALVTHQSGMGGAMPVDDDGNARDRFKAQSRNHHPTVKPTALMRYLCRLVTPPGGIVLDPFMGSGSTGKGAILEGFRFIGIERDPDYMQIAESRIKHAQEQAMEAEKIPHQLELEVASA